MSRGVVRSYNPHSAYGFAYVEGVGADVFFHRMDLADGRPPDAGDEVELEVVECPRGLRAKAVRVLQKAVGT